MPTSRRPLVLLGAALIALLAACGGEPAAAPASSSTGTSTTTVAPTTTTAALTKLSPRYAARLESARTTPCTGTDMFATTCGNYMVRSSNLANAVAADADKLGSTYGKVALASRDWATAADNWVSTCMPSESGSPTRIACISVLPAAITGAEAVLFAIADVEQPVR